MFEALVCPVGDAGLTWTPLTLVGHRGIHLLGCVEYSSRSRISRLKIARFRVFNT